jgi:UDP-N-acetyl-2-amino-2-deoxyglucuronate dehydrogenase
MKFGIIGLGNIGKRHALHIMQHPSAQLIAYCDLKNQSANVSFAHDMNYYTSVNDMLHTEDLDVVSVCTPNHLHQTHTIKALQQGCHVICEKPMAMRVAECDTMIKAAIEANKTIFVVKQNRYNEPVQQVKKLLNENKLGKIFFIQVNCFWNRNEHYYAESDWRGIKMLDGGCLFTQFSHFVDILFYLFGNIKVNYGTMKNFNHLYTEVEDTGSFVMETAAGAMVNFNFSTCSYEKNMEGAFAILGEKGTVKIGGQYLNTIEYQHIDGIVLPDIQIQAKANDYGKYQGSMSNHDKMIDNVIQTLEGKASIMTNADEGKNVVGIIEAMYQHANR